MANYPQSARSTGGKRMFPLVLNDVEVRTLEELRDNFDLERVVEYFKSGELLTWLEDRFYDDEAEAIENIDADDRNLTAKICAALDVEGIYLDFARRLPEKKARLAEMTDDDAIIDNAASTALDQEDLATLIKMDCKTIYLCGENFNVPIRVAGVKYIGVLSTPKIKIRAKTQDDLDAAGIAFENVQLCLTIDKLKALAEKIFRTGGKWPIVEYSKTSKSKKHKNLYFDQLDKTEQSTVLRMICQGKYTEQQIAFLQVTDDLSSGFALTVDSFCTGGGVGNNKRSYKDIRIENSSDLVFMLTQNGDYKHMEELCSKDDLDKIEDFLEVAKTF